MLGNYRHHSGSIYSLIHIGNTAATDRERFPITAVYVDNSGNVWTRPLDDFKATCVKIAP